ncbi:MAG: ABC transporter ATP-binding protein, partial [Candidatus Auribacterota bacterium]|nr:ABC transporter ATP-binding protein [Candidatus Auribacterota bacterium]
MKREEPATPSGSRDLLIEVSGLTKRFDEVTALDDISFNLYRGELFGFLGPNGAGKTTTINILTGLSRPDSGTIRIGDKDCTENPKAAQFMIGVVSDESNLYPELSGFDNLCFCASLYGMPKNAREERAGELLETFGLKDAAERKFAAYSRGMKRKLTIAAGIIHNPRILFLDEPTTGIDVAS